MSNKNWINYDSSIKTGQRCDKPHIKMVSTILHTLFLIPEKLSCILVPGETWAAISSLHCLCDICAKERRILCMTVQMEVSKLIKIKLIQLKVKSWCPSADKQVSVTNMKHVLKIFMRTEGSDWIWTHLSRGRFVDWIVNLEHMRLQSSNITHCVISYNTLFSTWTPHWTKLLCTKYSPEIILKNVLTSFISCTVDSHHMTGSLYPWCKMLLSAAS